MKAQALLAALSGGILSFAAHAATQPDYGPPDAWVRQVAPGETAPADTKRASQIILLNKQDRILPGGQDSYTEMVTAIQTADGLSDGGAVQFEWDPDTETPVVHRLVIRRGGKTIDVLAQGQSFSVLRRESNLADDVLDGRLTAVLEPEGLQAGDVVDFAYTIRNRDPLMQGHAENIFRGPLRSHASHLYLRQLWPAGHAMNWRLTEGLDKPVVATGKDGTDLVLDMHDVAAPATPEGAPQRYRAVGQLAVTDFGSWNDLAALFGPLYTQAASLAAGSPIRAEAARIRAATNDPRARAAAALRLVQEKVRYVLLAMNGGGYRPAAAEATWQRRFGDCKGKTVLLVALLRELGIDAVPALVSTGEGDGLDARLPAAGWFDHAIVRASIDGRVYWLDGTRAGDSDIDALRVPDYHWALALPAAGAAAHLEKLEVAPASVPDASISIAADATGGIFAPVPARVTVVMRGDLARGYKTHTESMPYQDLRRDLRQQLQRQYGLRDITRLDFGFYDASGEEKLVAEGRIDLEVGARDAAHGRTIHIANTAIDRASLFDREDGPHDDAPFALPLPDYNDWKVSIALPRDGAGFTLAGKDYDIELAGLALHRATYLKAGELVVQTRVKTLAAEIPAPVARAAAADLAALAQDGITVHVPAEYRWTDADYRARAKAHLASSDDLLDRAVHRLRRGDNDGAVADLTSAIALDASAPALSNRAIAYHWMHDDQRANADLDRAAQLNPHDGAVSRGRGLLALAAKHNSEALADFDAALQADPKDADALANRGAAAWHLNQLDRALADYAAALRLEPDWTGVAWNRWAVLMQQNKPEIGLAEADAWVTAHPGDARAHLGRARLLWTLKRAVEARAEVDASIAMAPTAAAYVTRARMIDATDPVLKLQALDRAIAIDPHLASAYLDRGFVLHREKQYDLAAQAFGQAIANEPDADDAFFGRGEAYEAAGKFDLALGDIDVLISRHKDDWRWLNMRCWVRGTSGRMLQEALEDCDAALKLKPDAAEALDSRGLVHLRLGQYDQAIADYDAALHLRPRQPTSLLGRSIAERRRGGKDAAERDLAAARGLDPAVEAQFALYGVGAVEVGKI